MSCLNSWTGSLVQVSAEHFQLLKSRFPGTKALVWDSALTGPLGLIAEYQHLKEHEVMREALVVEI